MAKKHLIDEPFEIGSLVTLKRNETNSANTLVRFLANRSLLVNSIEKDLVECIWLTSKDGEIASHRFHKNLLAPYVPKPIRKADADADEPFYPE